MSEDELAAALGYATTLSEGMLPKDDLSTEEGEAAAPEEEVPTEPEMEETPEAPTEEVSPEKDPANEAQNEEIRALWQEIGRLKGESKEK